jgi:hypothetical protein
MAPKLRKIENDEMTNSRPAKALLKVALLKYGFEPDEGLKVPSKKHKAGEIVAKPAAG